MKYRILAKILAKAIKTFPSVVVTGPRQSGKTTLLKSIFSDTHRFVSLEDPDMRLRAKEDPIAFLDQYRAPVIFDEIQYVPELLAYIKTRIDERRKPGQWLLTGSQNFVLMKGVGQSLAGRVAVLSLLPFSYAERTGHGKDVTDITHRLQSVRSDPSFGSGVSLQDIILRGHYPEIASKKSVDRNLWCGSYIATYLERDVRNISQIGDLNQFERFLRLCAINTGQILNLSGIARDIGISVPTARRWLSILEASYLVYLLYPYHRNLSKRLIKSPKLYFVDTALASYLLGIHHKESLLNSPNFGSLFETMIVSDFLKRFLHFGQMPSMYYLKTRDSLEVDLVIEINQKLYFFEIKSSMTITSKHAVSLKRMKAEFTRLDQTCAVISNSRESFLLDKDIMNYNWKDILS